MLYYSLKSLHLIAVMSWMAGMLYMPRLFVYHHKVNVGGDASETFKVMEHKLAKLIMRPAMLVTWIAGLSLLYVQGIDLAGNPWMAIKLLSVLAMTYVHMMYLKYIREFAADERPKTEKFFRVLNEGPTLLMVIIVVMVVFKPQFGL
ncbi:MAG: protoporphyrinogen oxidase HemJ [Pseudomonadota bacterium]